MLTGRSWQCVNIFAADARSAQAFIRALAAATPEWEGTSDLTRIGFADESIP
jgi:hypothetical protein